MSSNSEALLEKKLEKIISWQKRRNLDKKSHQLIGLKYYNELSKDLLYLILKTRQEVFVIEQNCNYLDADDYDQFSHHLMGFQDNRLIAYMRIIDKGHLYDNIAFGRILVIKEYRGMSIGNSLMQKGLSHFTNKNQSIIMSAQSYLIDFYKKFNFKTIGEEYLEDNILHVKMIRNG